LYDGTERVIAFAVCRRV